MILLALVFLNDTFVYLQGNARNEKKSVTLFDQSLKLQKKNISAFLGRAHYYEKRQAWDKSLNDLNQVIVYFPNYLPALIDKARVLMVMGNWEEALETAQRVLKRDSDAIGALRLIVLYLLARETGSESVSGKIADLSDVCLTFSLCFFSLSAVLRSVEIFNDTDLHAIRPSTNTSLRIRNCISKWPNSVLDLLQEMEAFSSKHKD